MADKHKTLWLAFGIVIHLAVIVSAVALVVEMIRSGMCHG